MRSEIIIKIKKRIMSLHPKTKQSILVVLFLAVVTLPLTIFVVLQRQDLRNRAQVPPDLNSLEDNTASWTPECNFFTDGKPVTACPADFVSRENGVLTLTGSKNMYMAYKNTATVLPNTYYKISARLKVEDRHVFPIAEVTPGFPRAELTQRDNQGQWEGLLMVKVNGIDMLPDPWIRHGNRAPSEFDWYTMEAYMQTPAVPKPLNIGIYQHGFWGKVKIDALKVEKVDSFIDDKYFDIPITTEYQGMKIKNVLTQPADSDFIERVDTSAASFRFSPSAIVIVKDNASLTTIRFPDNFLSGLRRVTSAQGTVKLVKDGYIMMSIGSDSVMLSKLYRDVRITVEGPKPLYHYFEAGVIFTTDYQKGVVFSPLRPMYNINTMDPVVNPANNQRSYPDSIFTPDEKNWNLLQDFTQTKWVVEYNTLKAGSGFMAEVAPPKPMDMNKFCSERLDKIPADIYSDGDYGYTLQKVRERNTVMLIWIHDYAESRNTAVPPPPTEYCTDSTGTFISCNTNPFPPGAKKEKAGFKAYIPGPYEIINPVAQEKLRSVVTEAHNKQLQVILYVTPAYFYAADVDKFLQNMEMLVDEYGIDGFYYDGLFSDDFLKSLELVRRTRNNPKIKFYTQHKSSTNEVILKTNNFRIPTDTAYADLAWLGEHVVVADDPTWTLNYCSKNVSNTPSTLLSEIREVDRTDPVKNAQLMLSPEQQIDKSLACVGKFRVSSLTDKGNTYDDKELNPNQPFDADYYWDKYDAMCLPHTCGNGVCNVGETIHTCQSDCAPRSADLTAIKNNTTYTCSSNAAPAQWIIEKSDGSKLPLYAFHFTFDDDLAFDYSGNKQNPGVLIGRGNYNKPVKQTVDEKNVFYFDGTSTLFGEFDEKLDFTGKDFSIGLKIKPNVVNANKTLLSLGTTDNQSSYFTIGITSQAKPYIGLAAPNAPITYVADTTLNTTTWYTITVTYNDSTKKLKLYVNGEMVREDTVERIQFAGRYDKTTENFNLGEYTIAGKIRTAEKFKGYMDDIFMSDRVLTEQQVREYHRDTFKTITFGTAATNAVCLSGTQGTYTSSTRAFAPPVVNITSPREGEEIIGGGAAGFAVPVTATASTSEGTITKVDFFIQEGAGSSRLVSTDTTSPYTASVPMPHHDDCAVHTMTAKARAKDSNNGVTTASVTFTWRDVCPPPTLTPTQQPSPTRTPTDPPTPTPLPPPAIIVAPLMDAPVSSLTSTRNYGTGSKLWVDGGLPIEKSYLKFDLTPYAGRALTSIVLKLKVAGGSSGQQTIRLMNDTTWRERGITYDTKPVVGTTIGTINGGIAGEFVEINITSTILPKLALGQTLFTIGIEQTSWDGIDYHSQNTSNPSDRPHLVLN